MDGLLAGAALANDKVPGLCVGGEARWLVRHDLGVRDIVALEYDDSVDSGDER